MIRMFRTNHRIKFSSINERIKLYLRRKGDKIMNKALIEFKEKSINFDWAALAQLAKDHVNPEELIKDIYSDGYTDGFKDGYSGGVLAGKTEVIIKIATIGIPLATLGTYGVGKLLNRHKKSKEEIEILIKENAKLKAEKYAEKVKVSIKNEGITDNIISINFKNEIRDTKSVN